MIWAVVMAGGQGTRFWPLSTPQKPKQLLPLVTRKTMLEETAARLGGLVKYENILVITNRLQAPTVKKLLPRVPKRNIIAEPCGRSTAPCIGLAAHIALKRDPNAVLIALPADQMISKRAAFMKILRQAVAFAAREEIHVTLGFKPTFPATGYGYIKAGKRVKGSVFQVKRFIEKPPIRKAKKIYRDRKFSWNSGIFIWRADTFLKSLKKYLPSVSRGLNTIAPAIGTSRFDSVLKRTFPKLPSISVDYGIMEKTPKAMVICCDIGWSDVGSWDTASAYWSKDEFGNAVRGNLLAIDSQNNIVFNEAKTPIACIGVEGLTIVSTPAGILICDSQRGQDVRQIVDHIR